jgi:uncharacterized protein YktB (UPF0637 family)
MQTQDLRRYVTPTELPDETLADMVHAHTNRSPRDYTNLDLLLKHLAHVQEDELTTARELEDLKWETGDDKDYIKYLEDHIKHLESLDEEPTDDR